MMLPYDRYAIRRVIEMEERFDRLQAAAARDPVGIFSDPGLTADYKALSYYYEKGEWLADFTADEAGMFPQTLKRGILSQDALYNLMRDLDTAILEHRRITGRN